MIHLAESSQAHKRQPEGGAAISASAEEVAQRIEGWAREHTASELGFATNASPDDVKTGVVVMLASLMRTKWA